MSEESEKKSALVRDFKKLGHYGRRIEDRYGVGFPDLILMVRDYPVFICEAKIVRGSSFKPTARQFLELRRLQLSPKHCVPCLLGFDGAEMYLHGAAPYVKINECLVKCSDETVVGFFKRFYHSYTETT